MEELNNLVNRDWVGDKELEETKLIFINDPIFEEINTPIKPPSKEDLYFEGNPKNQNNKLLEELLIKFNMMEDKIKLIESKIDYIKILIEQINEKTKKI